MTSIATFLQTSECSEALPFLGHVYSLCQTKVYCVYLVLSAPCPPSKLNVWQRLKTTTTLNFVCSYAESFGWECLALHCTFTVWQALIIYPFLNSGQGYWTPCAWSQNLKLKYCFLWQNIYKYIYRVIFFTATPPKSSKYKRVNLG